MTHHHATFALCRCASLGLSSGSGSAHEGATVAAEAHDAVKAKRRVSHAELRIPLKAVDLRTEYHVNPVGMDEPSPRFSYRVEPDLDEAWAAAPSPRVILPKYQSARRIRVREKASRRLVWDSGWIESGETIQIEYRGAPLRPFTAYTWSVAVRDEYGRESGFRGGGSGRFSASFETGFLGTPWQADWIGTKPHSKNLQPVPVFRGEAPAVPDVAEARLYITALGLYHAYLNGRDVFAGTASALDSGDAICMVPGWTDYHHRVQYQAYDVTGLVRGNKRNNILAVFLAEGWYAGRIARIWSKGGRPTYGKQPLFKAELHIRRSDGSCLRFVTDGKWNYKDSAIRMSDIYDGEDYDAGLADDDRRWISGTSAQLSGLKAAKAVVFRSKKLDAIAIEWHSGAFVRRMRTLEPESVRKLDDGSWVVDFGQNFTGRERIRLPGSSKKGGAIRIRHAEMLNPDGTLYTDNLRSARATTCISGVRRVEAVHEPEFTFYGFRYLGIEGWPSNLSLNRGKTASGAISAVAVYSDLRETGDFTCSDPLLNRLFRNIVWGQRSNFLDIPTDCPQRDERLGWTADTQVFANAATYNMDAAAFYSKWLRDLNLCQSPEGGFPSFAPDPYRYASSRGGALLGYAAGWSDAGIVVPWILYTKYGDKRALERYFDNMLGWLELQERLSGGTYIVDCAAYGDWLNMNADLSKPFVATAYFAAMNALAARIARVIGREADARKREKVFRKTKRAFRQRFFDSRGQLKEKTQTAALFVLSFGLCDRKERRNALDFLVTDITKTRRNHLSTGFLGTPLLLRCLTENGRVDLAYRLLLQTSFPSWLYPVTQGATTMWERWDSWNSEKGFGDVSMNSFNHYAYGAVADWFYETICGIRPIPDDPAARGFRRFRLAPVPGNKLKSASST